MVDIELVDDGEEEDDVDEVEVEQGSLQGSWGGIEVEEKLLVELDPVELLTSLYGKTPRIGAVVVESAGKDAVNILIHTQTNLFTSLALCFYKLARWEESFILVELQEKPCLLILILDSVVVGNSWQGEHDSKEIEQ